MKFDFSLSNNIDRTKWVSKIGKTAKEPWEKEIVMFLSDWFSEKDEFEIKTSGTTGPVKTEIYSRSSLIASANITIATFSLTPGDTLLMCLPTKFVAGKMMLVRAIAGKMKLLALKPKSNPIENLDKVIDFAAFTPHQMQHIIQESSEMLNLIKKVIIGGSPVNDSLKKQLLLLNPVFYETYGMSETLTHIAIRPLHDSGELELFTVLKGFKIKVDKESRLVIDAKHLHNCPIVTADMVEIMEQNKFKWLGRADDVINSGGVKLFPALIEKKLSRIINRNFIITKQNDSDLGEVVVLIIEGDPISNDSLELLKTAFIKSLDKYEIPRKINYTVEFPRNNNGKIIRSGIK